MIAAIHARVCLVKAVQQVMHNALSLLGIEPFNRL
jgi:arginyl-tRNA synthetase